MFFNGLKKSVAILALAAAVFSQPALGAAAPVSVEGVGLYALDAAKETLAHGKEAAKLEAERDALEKVIVALDAVSGIKDAGLTHDEIMVRVAGIMKVQSVKYEVKIDDNDIVTVRSKIQAEADSEEVEKLFSREQQQK